MILRHGRLVFLGLLLPTKIFAFSFDFFSHKIPLTTISLPKEKLTLNWKFESHNEPRFMQQGRLPRQPICTPFRADRLEGKLGSDRLVPLGGNYWKTPLSIGAQGNCRVDTGAWHSPRFKSEGKLVSPEFKVDFDYLELLVGGGGGDLTAVELEVQRAGKFESAISYQGPGTFNMQKVVWNLKKRKLLGETARLVIRDYSGKLASDDYYKGHKFIMVDEISGVDFPDRAKYNRKPVWGFVDLHTHLFNHLGFGGRQFHGKVWDERGIEYALPNCEHSHGKGPGDGVTTLTLEFGHNRMGHPNYIGWPKYSTLVHQQAYVDWIKRAWQGGLRIVHMDVGNSKFLAEIFSKLNQVTLTGDKNPLPYDDQSVVEIQVDAAYEFVTNGPGKEFAGIARTADEARRLINAGKLAIVLGIEVEALGNFVHRQELGKDPRQTIRNLVSYLYNLGVRHIIPIHLIQNAFGYPAVYERVFNSVNFAETNHWFIFRDAFKDGIRYSYDHNPADLITWFFESAGALFTHFPYQPVKAAANAYGLTPEGRMLLEEMMRLGFIIDVDHMSDLGTNHALDVAEYYNYPLISSHTSVREMSFGHVGKYNDKGEYELSPLNVPFDGFQQLYGTSDSRKVATERNRSIEQLKRIKKLGGMVGLGVKASGVGVSWKNRIPLDCDGTAKSFSQIYLAALEIMDGEGVALGSDVNGFAGLSAPRFGTDACAGLSGDQIRSQNQRRRKQAFAQKDGVRYQDSLKTAKGFRFAQHGDGTNFPYVGNEREVWEAIAYVKAGVNINTFNPEAGFRWSWDQNRIRNFAKGFKQGLVDKRQGVKRDHQISNEDIKAAYLAVYNIPYNAGGRDRVLRIWKRWLAMESGKNPPIKKYMVGNRGFDLNLDGMSHYGLLPDFLQDVVNVGVSVDEMAPLFNSAEYYLKMWEKVERRSYNFRNNNVFDIQYRQMASESKKH